MTRVFNERLFQLLPSIYRQRDAEFGDPLKHLLDIVAEQVDAVEADIARMYDDWFIETCADWVVPYIGDLIGHRAADGGTTAASARRDAAVLDRRSEVANVIRYRKRKGTRSVLEDLAFDVAGWPGRLVEFGALVAATQAVKYPGVGTTRTAAVRRTGAMGAIDSPFEHTAHTVDVRRPQSRWTTGRYNVASVALFVWRLRSLSVSMTEAYRVEGQGGDECFTFSILANDTPLFARPGPPGAAPDEALPSAGLPVALGRVALEDGHRRMLEHHYGPDRSFALWIADSPPRLVPVDRIEIADLRGWAYRPPAGQVAVDPERGRIAFAPEEAPEIGLLVTYHYGQSMPIGGGQYARAALEWQPTVPDAGTQPPPVVAPAALYTVGSRGDYRHLREALSQWQKDKPAFATIEFTANDVHSEAIAIALGANQSLILRAADGSRPTIRILDLQANRADFFGIQGAAGSRILIEGLLVAGRGIHVRGDVAEVVLKDSTLVPGWNADADALRRAVIEPSIRLVKTRARVRIDRCIVGSISVLGVEPDGEPPTLTIHDSIVDSTASGANAIASGEGHAAHVTLTMRRTTVIGRVRADAVELIENCIVTGPVDIERRHAGCLRFSYVPKGSDTPPRYRCQPDTMIEGLAAPDRDAVASSARPVFDSERFGDPAYCRLAPVSSDAIVRGADDGSEMGVFHDLQGPRRHDVLQTRLLEYAPVGCDVGIIYAT